MLPSWGWWTLAGSVLVALIIMIVAYLITRRRINRVRDQFLEDKADIKKGDPNKEVVGRDEKGQMLWDLKEKTADPLDDTLLEYSINTVLRNSYKKLAVIGGSKYEVTSLTQYTGGTLADKDIDFTLVMDLNNLNDTFDNVYKSTRVGGMISVVNAPKKNHEVKKLLQYLKTTGLRFDYLKVKKGIILVVK